MLNLILPPMATLNDAAAELVYAGDAENLTHGLAIAVDLEHTFAGVALEWDAAVSTRVAEAGDWNTALAGLPF